MESEISSKYTGGGISGGGQGCWALVRVWSRKVCDWIVFLPVRQRGLQQMKMLLCQVPPVVPVYSLKGELGTISW